MSLAPGAEALANSYGSDVQALAIDVWDGNEAQVTIFVTGTKVEFPVLMYGNQAGILTNYNCSYDYFFIIDGDGIITWRGSWDEAAMTAALDDAVAALGPSDVPDAARGGHRLLPNAPNPFNPSTRLAFALDSAPGPVPVRLEIVDLAGRRVRTVANGAFAAGRRHEVVWDGRDDSGRAAPSGTYFARLEAGGVVTSRPVTLVK